MIAYSLLPVVCSGSVFGPKQRLILHLIDIPVDAMLQKMEGAHSLPRLPLGRSRSIGFFFVFSCFVIFEFATDAQCAGGATAVKMELVSRRNEYVC